MRDNDSSPTTPGPFQAPHDQLEEQQCRFRRAAILREIVEDAHLFFAAKRWVCQDYVDALILADFCETEAQRIAGPRYEYMRNSEVRDPGQEAALDALVRDYLRTNPPVAPPVEMDPPAAVTVPLPAPAAPTNPVPVP